MNDGMLITRTGSGRKQHDPHQHQQQLCDHCGADHDNSSSHHQPLHYSITQQQRYYQRHNPRNKNRHPMRWNICLQQVLFLAMVAGFVTFNYDYSQLRKQRTAARSRSAVRAREVDGGGSSTSSSGGSVPVIMRDQWISDAAQPFNQNGVAAAALHLIVVAGHSVTVSGHLEDADEDEQDWFLLEYQKNRGLPAAIVGHIRAGIELAASDPSSLLVFSGGETRAATGPETEGSSYYRVADAMNLWPPGRDSTLRARTVTEEFATDSYQNLLFSICRFYEVTGSYPNKITMVSFTFKKYRFETLHAPALQWPTDKFQYVGVDPPESTGFDLQESIKGELETAVKPFEADPYGCHSEVLKEKRRARNPFSRTPPYGLSCPDMKELLQHCGPELIAGEKVPWLKEKSTRQ